MMPLRSRTISRPEELAVVVKPRPATPALKLAPLPSAQPPAPASVNVASQASTIPSAGLGGGTLGGNPWTPGTTTGGQGKPDGKGGIIGSGELQTDETAPSEMDLEVIDNTENFLSAASKVSGGKWDGVSYTGFVDDGSGHRKPGKNLPWSRELYLGGSATPAQVSLLFAYRSSHQKFYTTLDIQERSIAKAKGFTPSEYRIWQEWQKLVGSPEDPGDAPLGSDGLPHPGEGGTGDYAPEKPAPTAPAPAPVKLPPLTLPPRTSSLSTVTIVLAAGVGIYLLSKL